MPWNGASGSIPGMSEQPIESTPEPGPPASLGPPARKPRRIGGLVFVLLVLAALAVAAWQVWPHVQSRWGAPPVEEATIDPVQERLAAVESELDAVRQTLRQVERRIGDSASGQRVLREEVLGMGERAALLEQSVAQLADRAPGVDVPLRLDEVELLLHMGQQRLQLANDRAGAVRAYVLANQVLGGLDDPAYISLRQTLGQELGALRALHEDPRDLALGGLDAFEAGLDALRERHDAGAPAAEDEAEPSRGAARLFGQLVRVRRSEGGAFLPPEHRQLGATVLKLELALARGAAERRDHEAFAAALTRIDAWLPRLYVDGVALRERRARLDELAQRPLSLNLPVLGTTLEQLRTLRAARNGATTDRAE